jgi:hypothetical protein
MKHKYQRGILYTAMLAVLPTVMAHPLITPT